MRLIINQANGWIKIIEDATPEQIADYKKAAQRNCAALVRRATLPEDARHLVYYYELGNDAKIWMAPYIVDDENFYRFIDTWHPAYVGAYHR